MTGQHTGHTRVRGNMCRVGGSIGYKGTRQVRRMSLTPEDVTVGHVLQRAGYRTALVGKWHLDAYDPQAGPLDRGFDAFSGWLINVDDTSGYTPGRRVVNRDVIDLPDRPDGTRPYSTDLCTDEAIAFVERHAMDNRPFFLYLAYNNPHSPFVVPDLGPYAYRDWPQHCKTYAAMIHRLDQSVGRLMQRIKALGIDDRTVVFFCSDNGPRSEPQAIQTEVVEFFNSNGPLRGYKRDMTEGGIRVPMIVRAPGRVSPGSISAVPWYFADVMATVADLGGAEVSPQSDGVSIAPILLGKQRDLGRRFLYWEYFEGGFQQAVRWEPWKAIRMKRGEELELYDLSQDIGEEHNVAGQHPDVIERIEGYLATARTESENWPLAEIP